MSGYRPRSQVTPERPTAPERAAASFVRGAVRVPGLRRFLLLPAIARIGYWIATGLAFAWGWVMFGRHSVREGLHVFSELPRWTFGRGGTTIGAIYLTNDGLRPRVLEHEAVHREQWKHYGLAFPVLYLAAGKVPRHEPLRGRRRPRKGGYV